MNRQKQLVLKRRSYIRFIRDDPIHIQLMRSVKTTTAAGGKVKGLPQALPFQTFRLVPSSGRNEQAGETSEGQVERSKMTLVGVYNADVQKGDIFEWDGEWYRVVSVDVDHEVRTAAGLVEHGTA